MPPTRLGFRRSDNRFMRPEVERGRNPRGQAMKTANGLSEGSCPPQAPGPLLGLPEGLCCPGCRGPVNERDTALRCGRPSHCAECGTTLVLRGGRIPDFLAGESPSADTILGWPDGFVQNLEPSLLALASGKSVSADTAAELEAQQLVPGRYPTRGEQDSTKYWRCDPGSRLTALGNNLAYHCAEFSLQANDGHAGTFLERFGRL